MNIRFWFLTRVWMRVPYRVRRFVRRVTCAALGHGERLTYPYHRFIMCRTCLKILAVF